MSRKDNATGVAGGQPMQQADPTAGSSAVGGFSYNLDSRNFNFTFPSLSLSGRAGMGLSLALSYNSKLWTYVPDANTMVFNGDKGFPAPGWRLGFGTILVKTQAAPTYTNGITGKLSVIYVSPDGARHELAYNPATSAYESYDSTHLRFELATRILRMTNGTQVHFTAESYANGDARFLPTLLKDRHGNFINIYYRTLTNNAVVPDYVIDTAGRRVDFNYQNNRLTSISQNRNGNTYHFVRIDYTPVTIQTKFGSIVTDPPNINGAQVYFPARISYPTGVNFRIGYTSYGQVNTVHKWVPAISGQGGERFIARTSLSMPHCVDPNAPPETPNYCYPQGDTLYFSNRTEWAENWEPESAENWQGARYEYEYGTPAGHEITDPTSRVFRLKTTGMVQSVEVVPPGGSDWTKKNEVIYISDSGLSYLSNPRVAETKNIAITNGVTQTKRVTFAYFQVSGVWLLDHRDEYDASGAVYRTWASGYKNYPAQYIIGFPRTISEYAGTGYLVSRIAHNYDETGTFTDSNGQTAPYLIDATSEGVIQHDANYGASFTERGNVTSLTQYKVENGAVTGSRITKRTSYDTNGNVRAMTDGAGNRSQFQFGDYCVNKPGGVGQTHLVPYTASDPTGFRKGSQWDYYAGLTVKSFNLTPGSSTETQIVTTNYDFADRPVQTTQPDGGWVKTAYWDNWLATVTSQLVETGKTRYKFEEYDGAGRVRRKASDHPDGVAGKFSGQVFVFDLLGQTKDSSNVIAINGNWVPSYEDASTGFLFTHLTRDELARLKTVTFPDSNTRQYDYTGCGCAGESETRITDEMGHYTLTRTDEFGRLVEAIEPDPNQSSSVYSKATYVYDTLDRLIRIDHTDTTLTRIQSRYFTYDGYGRLIQELTPEAGEVNYTYTANDLPLTKKDARNITTTFGYNTRNLTTSVSYSNSTPGVTFTYDGFGARQTMTDGEGSTAYVYNSFRQLQSETRAFTGISNRSYKLSYTYNLSDQLKQANYRIEQATPNSVLYDKNVNHAYNTVGALGGVGTNLIGSDPNATTNVLNSMTFRASGAIRELHYGNGRRLQMGYNANRPQPASMKVDRASNPSDKIIDYVYGYYEPDGKNNNRIRKVTDNIDPAYTTDYLYDDYNRLTSATAGAYTRSYAYDAWGNITTSGVTYNYATNASGAPATNRMSSNSQGVTYGHDNAGNMTQVGVTTNAYDGAGRLKSVNGDTTGTYGYDGNGGRVRVTDAGAAVFYVRSSALGDVAMEVNSSGVLRAYVYAGSKMVAQQSVDGQFYWLHTNHLGSARAMTDVNGNLVYRGQFDPYGKTLTQWSSSGNTNLNTRKFTGYERDATGLDYAGARMYNSGRGRYMQPDPARLKAVNVRRPQSLNLYSYVENDPINRVDPTGRSGIYFNPCWVIPCDGVDVPGGSSGSGGGGSHPDNDTNTKPMPRVDDDGDGGGNIGGGGQIDHSAILNVAITGVKDRLKTKACKDLFGGLDIDSYLANYISISDTKQDGTPFDTDRVYGSTGIDQYGNMTTVFNQNSSAFTGTQTVTVNGRTETFSIDTILGQLHADVRDEIGLRYIDSLAKFRELSVLHELLHASDKDGKYFDIGNKQKTIDNDRMIGEGCFK